MLTGGRAFGACVVVGVALLVAGCSSSGSGKSSVAVPNVLAQMQASAVRELATQHLIPKVLGDFGYGRRVGTVVRQSPAAGQSVPSGSTVRITVLYPSPGGGTGPANAAARLGPCPAKGPTEPMKALNAGVQGLGKKLVPIAAVAVRVCTYQERLNGTVAARQGSPKLAVPQLEAETNRLQESPANHDVGGCVAGPLGVFITFASDIRRVNMLDEVGCADAVTNGVAYVVPTTKWRSDLGDYTLPRLGGTGAK
jgi:PASTA domain